MGESDGVSPHPGIGSPPRRVDGGHSKRYRVWLAVAALLAIGGIAGTLIGARSVARTDAANSREAFANSSGEVASTLQLAIQRERDLVVSASAFFLGDPNATNAQFREWETNAQVFARFPELLGWGDLVIVPASRLAAFAARAKADPVDPLGPGGTLHVIPAGVRPYYCLVPVGQARSLKIAAPPGFDFCAGSTGGLTLASRDSGRSIYKALNVGDGNTLAVQTPFYRGGAIPDTVKARRAAFVGWMGVSFAPTVVLSAALAHHPNMAVAFRFRNASSNVVFRDGTALPGAKSLTINLPNGWTVETFGKIASGGILANGDALALLIAGLALSLVLGVLVLVLGTGRARALRLVTERTGELQYQALHDGLTGLPNRTLIMDRIEQLLARSRRAGTDGAALYVDLDEFKNVNDSMGHAAGDRLLVTAAARLKSALRDADTIGRMGGDEFVVLLDGGGLNAAPELVAERLLDVMRQPFDLDATAALVSVNTSIGIAVGDRASAGDLLRDADVALYRAKTSGRNCYQTFTSEMHTETSHRIELEFDLRSALQNSQFHLLYQPIYDLEDLTVTGVEALLRWQHPTLGVIQPEDFLPILEHSGQIRAVGHWVLLQACTQMAAWHAKGDTLAVSVNVSGVQFDSDAIIGHVAEALNTSGLNAASLIIEVTETALMRNANATARRLQAIKELGVKIAVDDFGTGYSSLAYLKQFPVDCLKIDRMFTNAIVTSPESTALIRTLIQLGKDLGLRTLAEGVESPRQLDHLRGEHVNEIQGFLLSQPLDAETLETQILAPARLSVPTAT